MVARILARVLSVRDGELPVRQYRAERWATVVALVLLLLALPIAAAMSLAKYDAATQEAEEKAVTTYRSVAVLHEDAVAPSMPPGMHGFPVYVLASWRGPEGNQREGQIPVEPELTAGAEVPVWVDADGELITQPRTHGEIVTSVAASGLWNLTLMVAAVLAAYWLVVRLIDKARMASWGAEWARVEPRWSRRR